MSIYEFIGGELLEKAAERFYERLTSDPVLSVHFEGADVAALTARQRMFLTAALGGPDAYDGRDMRAAHAGLPISDTDFDRFLDHLSETLAELHVAPERIDSVLEALRPLRKEIVSAVGEGADEWGSVDPSGGRG